MSNVMSNDGLDLIFRNARTHNAWLDKPVEDALLEASTGQGNAARIRN
ncbi:MAG TPA: hypothetical protein VKI17_09330 [Gemmataceae bacterium]|nr:hypothetical protein [Gemmataceae bacterium]